MLCHGLSLMLFILTRLRVKDKVESPTHVEEGRLVRKEGSGRSILVPVQVTDGTDTLDYLGWDWTNYVKRCPVSRDPVVGIRGTHKSPDVWFLFVGLIDRGVF